MSSFPFNVPPPNYLSTFGELIGDKNLPEHILKSLRNMQVYPFHESRSEFIDASLEEPQRGHQIERFLIERGHLIVLDDGRRVSTSKEQQPKNISMAREHLQSIYNEISATLEKESQLQNIIDSPDVNCAAALAELRERIALISSKLNECSDPKYLKKLRILIRERKRKRKWIRKQKDLAVDQEKVILKDRMLFHELLDSGLEAIRAKEREQLSLKSKKPKLSRLQLLINRKKREATEYIELFDRLKDYRKAKQVQNNSSELGEGYFNDEMDKLKLEWTTALRQYEETERKLSD